MILFAAGAVAILVTMALALARATLGPTVWDRIMAVNSFGTATVLLIAFLGYLTGRPEWEDIALVYALMNFISTIAVLKFINRTRPDKTPRAGKQPRTGKQTQESEP